MPKIDADSIITRRNLPNIFSSISGGQDPFGFLWVFKNLLRWMLREVLLTGSALGFQDCPQMRFFLRYMDYTRSGSTEMKLHMEKMGWMSL